MKIGFKQNNNLITINLKRRFLMREAQFTKSITIALSPEVYKQVKAISDNCKISMAEWFREMTKDTLDKIKEHLQND